MFGWIPGVEGTVWGDFSDLCVMSLRLDWRDCMAWERGWPGGLLWYPFKSGFT